MAGPRQPPGRLTLFSIAIEIDGRRAQRLEGGERRQDALVVRLGPEQDAVRPERCQAAPQ